MSQPPMPTRNRMQTLEAVKSNTGGGFDVDAWHVMDARDNALIADELLNGSGSNAFVYSFSLQGSTVAGISVIGARHLAASYGGIKHRLVASVQKIGSLFTFTSYPQPDMPMMVHAADVPQLYEEDDYYEAIVEIEDIKTGNSIQVQKREAKSERKRDGTYYDRPHYQIIAQSKAYRNGVLAILPQDVQMRFKMQMLQLGKEDKITLGILEEKRAGILRFAASKGLQINRHALEELQLAQILGMSDAVRGEGLDAFKRAAESVGVMGDGAQAQEQQKTIAAAATQKPAQQASTAGGGAAAAQTTQASQQQPQQQESASAAQPSSTGFGFYLIDQQGEITSDKIEEPKLFAEAIGQLLDVTSPDERPAIMEHNADAIAACATKGITISLQQIDYAEMMPLTKGTRGPDVNGWIKAAVARVATLAPDDLQRWVRNNAGIFEPFPTPKRLEVTKAVATRAKELGIATPTSSQPSGDLLGGADASTETPAKSAPELLADKIVAAIAEAKTRDEVIAIDKENAGHIKEFHDSEPELFTRISDALRTRIAEIGKGG